METTNKRRFFTKISWKLKTEYCNEQKENNGN